MKNIFIITLFLSSIAVANGASDLQIEFFRRDAIKLTLAQGNVINFLKVIKYPIETIIELEALEDSGESFFLKDRDNVVCFGSVSQQILRCKNEIGITGVTFTGDSD
jgi:hypothetical protein